MKVIMYKRDNSFLSRLVSIITGSEYTHSAVLHQYGNKCYFSDSSLSYGIIVTPLAQMPEYLKDREYEVYQPKVVSKASDLDAFVKMSELSGGDYDVQGAVTWVISRLLKKIGIFRRNSKLYCFEFTLELLKCYYNIDKELLYSPNGDTVRDFMVENGSKTRFLNCKRVG